MFGVAQGFNLLENVKQINPLAEPSIKHSASQARSTSGNTATHHQPPIIGEREPIDRFGKRRRAAVDALNDGALNDGRQFKPPDHIQSLKVGVA